MARRRTDTVLGGCLTTCQKPQAESEPCVTIPAGMDGVQGRVLKNGERGMGLTQTFSVAVAAAILIMSFSNANHAQTAAGRLARGADLVLLHGRLWTGEPYAGSGDKPAATRYAEALAV